MIYYEFYRGWAEIISMPIVCPSQPKSVGQNTHCHPVHDIVGCEVLDKSPTLTIVSYCEHSLYLRLSFLLSVGRKVLL